MDKEKASKEKENLKPYLLYKDKFLTRNKNNLIISILTVLIILFMMFLPVLKTSYTIHLSEIEDFETYAEILKDLTPQEILEGKFEKEKNFSIFQELIKDIKELTNNNESEYKVISLFSMMFPLLTIIMGIILLILTGKQLYEYITYYKDVDKNTMLSYDLIKKRSDTKEKNFFKKQNLMSFLLGFLFSILFGIVLHIIAPEIGDNFSYFAGFKGISLFSIIPIGLFITFLVFTTKNKKVVTELKNDIVREEYEKTENNI